MTNLAGMIVKQMIVAAIKAKWPNARLEFRVTAPGGGVYVTDKWGVTVASLQDQQLVIEVDATDAALEVKARRVS